MLTVVCPGQGAQSPGMFVPWLERADLRRTLAGLSEVAELDLVELGTTADAATIRATEVAQPLLVAAAVLGLQALLGDAAPADVVGVTAGHSVGELGACVVAGVLTAEQAMMLARERGRAMAQAAAATPTGMSAVVGGTPEDVEATLTRHGLVPANVNGSGQVVAAGTLEALAALAADPPARARVVPLDVAGAFHTEHMAPAVDHVRAVAATLTPADPRVPLLSNADGAEVTTGAAALERIVAQVARPVRWDLCSASLAERGVTAMVELLPGGVLTGLARRGLKGVTTVALKTPDDLPAARDLIAGGSA